MSIVRTGFVIACGVALLPADKAQQDQLVSQATQAAGWVATYCVREPAKCEQAAVLWDGFKEKAAFAGQLALEASQKYAAGAVLEGNPGSIYGADSRVALASNETVQPAVTRDTLTREDMLPRWRGPKK